jgi:hypothetical protein
MPEGHQSWLAAVGLGGLVARRLEGQERAEPLDDLAERRAGPDERELMMTTIGLDKPDLGCGRQAGISSPDKKGQARGQVLAETKTDAEGGANE